MNIKALFSILLKIGNKKLRIYKKYNIMYEFSIIRK